MKHSVLKELYTARSVGLAVNKLIYLIERLEDLVLQEVDIESLTTAWCIFSPIECPSGHIDKVVRSIFTKCCLEVGATVDIKIIDYPFRKYIPNLSPYAVWYIFTVNF
jgi:hypothetical protein